MSCPRALPGSALKENSIPPLLLSAAYYTFSLSLQELTCTIPNATVSAAIINLHHGCLELTDTSQHLLVNADNEV